MSANRPFVLSIAGFDPSGGAGVLADVKTFEQHKVYGLAIVTGNTIQTEDSFHAMHWNALDFILNSIEKLFKAYDIKAVKIGIIPSLDYLKSIVEKIRKHSSTTKIVWDTILKSSTEFEFATIENQSVLIEILNQIDVITPNYNEIVQLGNNQQLAEEISLQLSKHCAILLKGGHNSESIGTDYLYNNSMIFKINPYAISVIQKHGSGCVLSSAITANLALNNDLPKSCQNSKLYIENFLNTNKTLLGYHHV